MHERMNSGKEGAVICVHPPCLTSRLFVGVEDKLEDSNNLIRWDIRGHGLSTGGSRKLTLAMIAEDMRLLMDELGLKKAYVCGYSTGSMPALAALLLYPERFAGGILLSGTASYTDILSRSRLQAAYISSILAPKETIAFKAAWIEANSRAEFEALNQEAKQGDRDKWREYTAACLDSKLDRQIQRIKQPVLLLYGTEDRTGASNAAVLRRKLPSSELYGIIGAKGQLLTREPTTTAFVISQWLDKQRRPEIADTFEERAALLKELEGRGVKEGTERGLVH
ncbi:alpha/beta fold hydrolase [Paenibacillus sp. R14(2021)]|uniref:alpha/beta fold hydrolase n=1 Tax=Paenibacillus sp. R14(2021) TaxID=2859228 RepID=UPI002158677E|nr:alpha/beta hydrolase [Paenibacillus sp. R14(2021)]